MKKTTHQESSFPLWLAVVNSSIVLLKTNNAVQKKKKERLYAV